MSLVVFVPNPLLKTVLEHTLDMTEPAEAVVAMGRSIAPVLTGAYQASIHVESDGEGARVVADVPYAIYVELGTSDTAAQHVLTRAAEGAGLHIGGSPI